MSPTAVAGWPTARRHPVRDDVVDRDAAGVLITVVIEGGRNGAGCAHKLRAQPIQLGCGDAGLELRRDEGERVGNYAPGRAHGSKALLGMPGHLLPWSSRVQWRMSLCPGGPSRARRHGWREGLCISRWAITSISLRLSKSIAVEIWP